MNRQKSKRNIMLIGILCVLIIVVTAAIAMYITSENGSKAYQKKLDLARQYISVEDYQGAIQAYAEAIYIDQNRTEAYIGLADTYILLNDYDSANYILQRGLTATRSAAIQDKLTTLAASPMAAAQNTAQPDQGEPDAKDKQAGQAAPVLNTAFLDKLATGRLTDFSHSYGSYQSLAPTASETYLEGTYKKLRFPDIGMECYYEGDTVDTESRPVEIHFKNLVYVFTGIQEGISFEELSGMGLQRLEVVHPKGKAMLSFIKDNYQVLVACDEEGNIEDVNAECYMILPEHEKKEENGTYTLSGVISDATTGDGIEGVHISLYMDNDKVAETSSNARGEYSFEDLQKGEFEISMEAEGYADLSADGFIYDYEVENVQNYMMSPEMADDQIRIILSWGAEPRDLDSHLIADNGEWCYFMNREISTANLDVDDMDGHGPETITITDIKGNYHYMVHDYTMSGQMSISGATVTIYKGNNLVETINVPAGIDNLWDVCWIRDGEIEIVNANAPSDGFNP